MVIVRENTEGMYAGQELYAGTDRSSAVLVAFNTRKAMLRISRYAFDYARKHGRKKVMAIHKANILKKFSGIFLHSFREVATEYPEIIAEDRIIDACCMQMVRKPQDFDVIVTTNLFGDILSDLAAGLVGGLGVAPGGNYGETVAMFEAVHGSAPDIAGKNLANPMAMMLAGSMMLHHLNESAAALKIEKAIQKLLREGKLLTPDLSPGSKYGTTDMTKALVDLVA
jgi:isocitrate dehydrogenase (NAD+)